MGQKLIEKCYEIKRFVVFVLQHFYKDGCVYRASALTLASLLALVPLMSVGLTIFSSFPVFHNLSQPIQDFIFDNFVPATGKTIQNYLLQFTMQVSKLSVWGILFLFITSLLVMITIDRAINEIWHVNTSRRGVVAFLIYWAILSLTPIILGLSLAASSYLISMPLIFNHLSFYLLNGVPFILSVIGFTFLYTVVPNCSVKISHSFWGALVAALLFEIAKQGFAYYLSHYDFYQLLYGAFATVPIFFIWIYWVWLITLLGAEISYAFSVHHQRRTGKPLGGFLHALFWLNLLWLAQKKGQGLDLDELVNANLQPFIIDINQMINVLTERGLIHMRGDGRFMLSKDLNEVSLYSLSQQLPYPLPTQEELVPVLTWKKLFKQADKKLQNALATNLSELFTTSSVS